MTAPATAVRAFQLDTAGGARFCLHHAPRALPARAALLYVHPFAEEMNKSRRMAAVTARAFAGAGFEVLQLDLFGCGDSIGDFSDATWSQWIEDVRSGCAWMQERSGRPPWLWGLRAGCLLSLDAARGVPGDRQPSRFLFWQPPASGKQLAQQFLRLRLAADALRSEASGDTPATDSASAPAPASSTDPLKAAPDETADSLEIAGYRLHPQLLAGLQQSRLRAPAPHARSVWLEATTRLPAALLPGTERALAQWRAAGHEVHARALAGAGFWQTQEIEEAPALVNGSVEAVLALERADAGADP